MKKQDINIPEDYISVIKHARFNPFPHNNKVRFDNILPYTSFTDFEAAQGIPTIRPGSRATDPTVNDIKQLEDSLQMGLSTTS